jgi:hypothetical protein
VIGGGDEESALLSGARNRQSQHISLLNLTETCRIQYSARGSSAFRPGDSVLKLYLLVTVVMAL